MNEIGTFDILGPNMIGPSSSHTAGALRIAFVAGRMVEKPAAVKFVLYGSFARTYHGHGTDRALVGGILGYHPDDERIRDSFELAKKAGLKYEFQENFTDKEIYPNTVDIYVTGEDGSVMSLRGKSIGGGNAVITKLNGVDVELTGNYSTLVVEHHDKKGTLARVATVLSDYDLNIGSLRLYRESKRKLRGDQGVRCSHCIPVLTRIFNKTSDGVTYKSQNIDHSKGSRIHTLSRSSSHKLNDCGSSHSTCGADLGLTSTLGACCRSISCDQVTDSCRIEKRLTDLLI